jgi:hypothetical protein
LAEEIRNAVDAYLSGVTPDELELLDVATRHAASAISEMSAMLEATNRKADAIFAELERLRGGRPPELSLEEVGRAAVGGGSGAKGKNTRERRIEHDLRDSGSALRRCGAQGAAGRDEPQCGSQPGLAAGS